MAASDMRGQRRRCRRVLGGLTATADLFSPAGAALSALLRSSVCALIWTPAEDMGTRYESDGHARSLYLSILCIAHADMRWVGACLFIATDSCRVQRGSYRPHSRFVESMTPFLFPREGTASRLPALRRLGDRGGQ